jgi:hypothetical protein
MSKKNEEEQVFIPPMPPVFEFPKEKNTLIGRGILSGAYFACLLIGLGVLKLLDFQSFTLSFVSLLMIGFALFDIFHSFKSKV